MIRTLILFCLILPVVAVAEEFNFEKGFLYFGDKMLKVEIANHPRLHSRGLMFRTELQDDEGMLFVFIGEQKRSFWMKNTFIDLDIGFFDKEHKLLEIAQMNAVKSEMQMEVPRYESREKAMYALEVKQGWFKRNKVRPGARFKLYKNKKP